MIKVLINGCNGKMGKEVANKIYESQDFEAVCGVDRMDTGDNNFPVFTNAKDITIIPEIIIDFSVPAATLEILEFASKHKIPTVIATTGFTKKEQEKINEYSKLFPIFQSSNMSYEINIMAKIVASLAQKLPDSDIEIVETHHNKKIDAPSGTALILANSINNACNNSFDYEYDRHPKREKRKKNEIGIHSLRGGTERGKHSVIFFGDNESLEITHNVTSRSVFANGALKAAKYIVHKDNGFYTMDDLCK